MKIPTVQPVETIIEILRSPHLYPKTAVGQACLEAAHALETLKAQEQLKAPDCHCADNQGGPCSKWELYEVEKKRLRQMDLTPQEYEDRIKTIAKKLRI